MKVISLEVAVCSSCPWYVPGFINPENKNDWCRRMNKAVQDKNRNKIPDWCPLPEKAGDED